MKKQIERVYPATTSWRVQLEDGKNFAVATGVLARVVVQLTGQELTFASAQILVGMSFNTSLLEEVSAGEEYTRYDGSTGHYKSDGWSLKDVLSFDVAGERNYQEVGKAVTMASQLLSERRAELADLAELAE